MIYVVAGDYRQFNLYCKQNNLNPLERSKVRYIASADAVRGLEIVDGDELVRFGTFYDRRDWWDIAENLRMADRRTIRKHFYE